MITTLVHYYGCRHSSGLHRRDLTAETLLQINRAVIFNLDWFVIVKVAAIYFKAVYILPLFVDNELLIQPEGWRNAKGLKQEEKYVVKLYVVLLFLVNSVLVVL